MGVKEDNLGISNGLLLASFILNYLIIRVKQRDFERGENYKKRENEREGEKNEEKAKSIGEVDCLTHDSSVEVGYSLCYFIVNS